MSCRPVLIFLFVFKAYDQKTITKDRGNLFNLFCSMSFVLCFYSSVSLHQVSIFIWLFYRKTVIFQMKYNVLFIDTADAA